MRKAFVGPLSYLDGAAAAWVYIPAAFIIYALTPLFCITPLHGRGPAQQERQAAER